MKYNTVFTINRVLSFFFPGFGQICKSFSKDVFTQDLCDQDQTTFIGHTAKCFHQGYFHCEILYL